MDLFSIGEMVIDFIPGTEPASYIRNAGGAPANVACAVSRNGLKAGMLCSLGDDDFGHFLADTLEEYHVRRIREDFCKEAITTMAFVTLKEDGDRSFTFARKPGADTCLKPEEIDEALISHSRAFHFGTLSLTDEPAASATRRAIEFDKAAGAVISCDPNLRKPLWKSERAAIEAIEWSLSQADIVKISDEEIDSLWHVTPEQGAQKLLDEYGVSLVYATLGPKGCYAATKHAAVNVLSPSGIRPIDTTGAGDIFGGSAMSRFLSLEKALKALTQEELRQIVRFACTAASLSTQKHGGIASVPEKEEVLRRMAV